MTVFTELVFTVKDPFLVDRNIKIQIGAIDEDGILSHITLDPALTVTAITANSTTTFGDNALVITPFAVGTVAYRLNYEGIEAVMSFFATAGIIVPTQTLLQRILYNTLPPDCYTQALNSAVFAKLNGIAAVYSDLYTDLQTVLLNFFPPFTDNIEWEDMLDDYYPWQDSHMFGLVVQMINNINQLSSSVFDLTLFFSQYLFARFGLEVYVFLEENPTPLITIWTLNSSILGDTTILGPGTPLTVKGFVKIASLTQAQLNEINLLAQKVVPISIDMSMEAEPDFSQFGLIVEVGDVYPLDPRLFVPFALKYDATAVFNAVGLVSPFNPFFATGVDYAPAGGTFAEAVGTIVLTATATFDFDDDTYFKDVTTATVFTSDNLAVLTIENNIITIVSAGTATVTAFWEGFSADHVFNISGLPVWVMGTSSIGAVGPDETILT